MLEVEPETDEVAIFLCDPTDPYGFYHDLKELSDDFLWNGLLVQQPTLAFSSYVIFGKA